MPEPTPINPAADGAPEPLPPPEEAGLPADLLILILTVGVLWLSSRDWWPATSTSAAHDGGVPMQAQLLLRCEKAVATTRQLSAAAYAAAAQSNGMRPTSIEGRAQLRQVYTSEWEATDVLLAELGADGDDPVWSAFAPPPPHVFLALVMGALPALRLHTLKEAYGRFNTAPLGVRLPDHSFRI